MSYFPRPVSNYVSDSFPGSQMDYLRNATYGRQAAAALSLDRISSLRDYPLTARPYAGLYQANPMVDNFVSQARNASNVQPVYETRGYRNFDRFDDQPRATRQSPRIKAQSQQQQFKRFQNKDLQDTSPKQVLKRPAPSSKASTLPANQQSLTNHLKKMGSDEPVIGLKHVTENVTEYGDSDKKVYSYDCSLCKVTGNAEKMTDHVTSKIHRKNYIKEHKLEEVADKDLAKRAAAIETVHGRGEWSVNRKTEGLKLMDKSKFFKKVKKNADIDMIDLSGSKSDNGMKDTDVIVDELLIGDDDGPDPESDPKFFVLKQISKMLDEEELVIDNEEMAMVVDSIIRKMDRALLQFVEIANAGNGVDEITLIDDVVADKKDKDVVAETAAAAEEKSSETKPTDAPVADASGTSSPKEVQEVAVV